MSLRRLPDGTIRITRDPWPEEIVNEQDEAEDAGQLVLLWYSEKDPIQAEIGGEDVKATT